MATLSNSFESPASGTTLAGGNGSNADGSTAWSSVSIGTGGTLQTDSTRSAHGTQSLKVASGGTAAMTYALWDNSLSFFAGGGLATVFSRLYVYFTANPANAFPVIQLVDHFSNLYSRCTINTSGKVVMNYGASNTIATTSTNSINLNGWTRIECKTVLSGGGATGQTEMKLFTTPESTSPVESANTSSTGLVMPGNLIEGARVGMLAATASQGPAWLDSYALSDTAYLGPDTGVAFPLATTGFFAA